MAIGKSNAAFGALSGTGEISEFLRPVEGWAIDDLSIGDCVEIIPNTKLTDVIHAIQPPFTGQGALSVNPVRTDIVAMAATADPYLMVYRVDAQGRFIRRIPFADAIPAGSPIQSCRWSPDGQYLALSGNTANFRIMMYHFDLETERLTRLQAPEGQPASNARGIAWSPNSKWVVFGHQTTPFMNLYRNNFDGTFTQMTGFYSAALPNYPHALEWSPDGAHLAASTNASPFIALYGVNDATGYMTALANPATLPPALTYQISYKGDGSILTFGRSTTPFIQHYARAGDTYTPITATYDVAPTADNRAVKWVGEYCVAGRNTGDYLEVYRHEGGTAFTKIGGNIPVGITTFGAVFNMDVTGSGVLLIASLTANFAWFLGAPDTLTPVYRSVNPGAAITSDQCGMSASPGGAHVAIPGQTGGNCILKNIGDEVWTRLPVANFDVQPPGITRMAAYSPDGKYLAIAHSLAPFFSVYKRNGDYYVKLGNPDVQVPSESWALAWSPDSREIVVGRNTTPWFHHYAIDEYGVLTKLPDPDAPNARPRTFAWSADGEWLFVGTAAGTTSQKFYQYRKSNGRFVNQSLVDTSVIASATMPAEFASHPRYNFIVVTHTTTTDATHAEAVRCYTIVDGSVVRLPNPDLRNPAGTITGCKFSLDGKFLVITRTSAPVYEVFEVHGMFLSPSLLNYDNINMAGLYGGVMTGNNGSLIFGKNTEPYLYMLKMDYEEGNFFRHRPEERVMRITGPLGIASENVSMNGETTVLVPDVINRAILGGEYVMPEVETP